MNIMKMAEQAGFHLSWVSDKGVLTRDMINKLANLVLEECAVICDDVAADSDWPADGMECAAKIRRRMKDEV